MYHASAPAGIRTIKLVQPAELVQIVQFAHAYDAHAQWIGNVIINVRARKPFMNHNRGLAAHLAGGNVIIPQFLKSWQELLPTRNVQCLASPEPCFGEWFRRICLPG